MHVLCSVQDRLILKHYLLLVWNSNVPGRPVFYLAIWSSGRSKRIGKKSREGTDSLMIQKYAIFLEQDLTCNQKKKRKIGDLSFISLNEAGLKDQSISE